MNNKTMSGTPGQNTSRFNGQQQPQAAASENPLGTNIPPEAMPSDDEARDEDSPFRRLNRYQNRSGAASDRFRTDWDRYRSYPDQTVGTDRNRERQWDVHPRESMTGRADSQRHGVTTPERDARGERSERPGGPWWQREALTAADIMTMNIKSVEPDSGLRDVAEIMRQEDVGMVPVVRPDGRLFGLITDRDIVVRALAGGKPLDDFRARDLATRDIEVVEATDALTDVIALMGRQQVRRVPVVDDRDRLVGLVSMSDVANRADYHEDLQQAFQQISSRRSFWSRIWR